MKNVKIKALEIYHPSKKIANDYFINHFNSLGKDISHLLEGYGKNERYFCEGNENALTMGINAAKKALASANLTGQDIDMILFSSSIPEYNAPTQALFLHRAINAKKSALIMDTNVSCVGMLTTFDMAVKYLQTSKDFKTALIVGSEHIIPHTKKDDEYTYPMFGDLACALILEKTDEDSYLLGTKYISNSEQCDIITFPSCGSSNMYESDLEDNFKIKWTPFNGNFIVDIVKDAYIDLLSEYNLSISDISLFCVTQFAKPIITTCIDTFKVSPDKVPYVGDKFGYTATTSPFLTLYYGIKNNKVHRGDYVALWSVGTNWITCSMILKY